ncbi:methylmalonyl-CoA epimerase [Carboxydothermus islandicus]|uniref:Methylmalonyl-CoA epimerase n=1 Tax=Carboxydothermus islandicus TaxID=661089 RepID=A0A1L8D4J6_9THEO|nr:methylmalonyl-CoA epimerase [Carboxydothermus islandicus]GAV26088.1 methylmalonyl-CoA epimerase [Carboxydothermus islandicus]
MFKKIDHIGIAVANLEQSVKTFELFGFQVAGTEEVPEQKVKVAFFPVGETNLELLMPTDEKSAVARFLMNHGEGIHHIAFLVENLEEILAGLKEKGFNLIDEKPRIGAHGKKIAFIHPKSINGVLIELCEVVDDGE